MRAVNGFRRVNPGIGAIHVGPMPSDNLVIAIKLLKGLEIKRTAIFGLFIKILFCEVMQVTSKKGMDTV